MTDKKSSDSRRKLLKSIAAGSGAIVAGKCLPEKWSRPVVDSVILPVHARTSTIRYSLSQPLDVGINNSEDKSLLAIAVDEMVTPARAGAIPGGYFYACITIIGNIASVVWMSPFYNTIRRGDITLGTDMRGEGTITARYPEDVSPDESCSFLESDPGSLTRPARIDASDPNFVIFEIQNKNGSWNSPPPIPRSDRCDPEPLLDGECIGQGTPPPTTPP